MEHPRKKIFLVDDNITNLTVGKNALSELYDIFTIPSGEKMFKILEKVMPDMILLDIEMPEMNGYEILKRLKEREETKQIPVIFVTAKGDTGSELEGLELGAIDYISKPFSPPLLLKRIEVHLLVEDQKKALGHYNENLEEMVLEKTRTVLELQNVILKTMAELVEFRDDETGGHIDRTKNYLEILVNALTGKGLYKELVDTWDQELLVLSAQLHDVGKISIRDSILLKPGRLTEEEFSEMKKHTTYGVRMIERIIKGTSQNAFLSYAKTLAGYHHEKWDGSGYPHGVSGENIPLEGRLMAIADVYDALISERPYKKPFSHEEAIHIIAEGRGTHFDPGLVDLFLSVADQFHDAATKVNLHIGA